MFTLRNIIFDAHPGDLICIIGPVGSGKVCIYLLLKVIYFISLEFTFTNINR
jgi:ABC-type polysaccharide/polyol phosphate transport system ATPase subunit